MSLPTVIADLTEFFGTDENDPYRTVWGKLGTSGKDNGAPASAGVHFWPVIHDICWMGDRLGKSAQAWETVRNLVEFYPGRECAEKGLRQFGRVPLVINGGAFDASVALHNLVNEDLGKPTIPPQNARSAYETRDSAKPPCKVKSAL